MYEAVSEPIPWTDRLVAVGTVILGVAAVLSIALSWWLAAKQRASAELDRAQAAANLDAERAYNDRIRLQDRQAGYALELLAIIDHFQQVIRDLPLWVTPTRPLRGEDPYAARRTDVVEMMQALRTASQTVALLIADDEISFRISNLLQLAEFAAEWKDPTSAGDVPAINHLRLSDPVHQKVLGYSIFVQIGLKELATGTTPKPNAGPPYYPILDTVDRSLWFPNPTPESWQSAIQSNRLHPQYRKLSDRRGE